MVAAAAAALAAARLFLSRPCVCQPSLSSVVAWTCRSGDDRREGRRHCRQEQLPLDDEEDELDERLETLLAGDGERLRRLVTMFAGVGDGLRWVETALAGGGGGLRRLTSCAGDGERLRGLGTLGALLTCAGGDGGRLRLLEMLPTTSTSSFSRSACSSCPITSASVVVASGASSVALTGWCWGSSWLGRARGAGLRRGLEAALRGFVVVKACDGMVIAGRPLCCRKRGMRVCRRRVLLPASAFAVQTQAMILISRSSVLVLVAVRGRLGVRGVRVLVTWLASGPFSPSLMWKRALSPSRGSRFWKERSKPEK